MGSCLILFVDIWDVSINFCFLLVLVIVCVFGSIWNLKPRVCRSLPGNGIGTDGNTSFVLTIIVSKSVDGNSSTTGLETFEDAVMVFKWHNKDFCLR